MFVVCFGWCRYPVCNPGLWLWVPACAGTTVRVINEFAAMGKPLALDACRQRRRTGWGLLAQDRAAAICSLHPSAGRLSFRLHQARPDRCDRLAVYGQGGVMACVCSRWHGVVFLCRAVRSAICVRVLYSDGQL